ncbi:hypothetical protein, partial [Klebsiella variicola]|uniref:hypothetical protein n=1 Tax=Klebsiella variicola TaxID=244366 RepID=UPI001C49814F
MLLALRKVIDYKIAQHKSNRLQKEDRQTNSPPAKRITIKRQAAPPDGGASRLRRAAQQFEGDKQE